MRFLAQSRLSLVLIVSIRRNLLAFLVLTSGLDNMIIVLRAIADTDIHLPVPQRMSAGLKAVGVEMSILLLVDEIMALGLLWWVDIAVRGLKSLFPRA